MERVVHQNLRRLGLAVLALALVFGAAIPASGLGWSTQQTGTYDGCQYRFLWGTWVANYPAAKTVDENGGCQYQYVKAWDSDETHIHGPTASNPAIVVFNDHDYSKTAKWQVTTWEHGWTVTKQKTFSS